MRRRGLLLGALLVALVAAAVILLLQYRAADQANPLARGTYGLLTPEQLAGMLEKKDFAFINVHIPYDGEIDKTDAFVPYNEIGANLAQLPAQKNAKIVLYCRSDPMSAMAAEELVKRGYTNVSHLVGGMVAWKKAGYSVVVRRP